jgi:cytochrome oxidase assembly protein ShyY1
MKFAFVMYDEESTGSITHRELVKILRANHMARSEGEVARKAETIIAQCDKRNDGGGVDEIPKHSISSVPRNPWLIYVVVWFHELPPKLRPYPA